MTLREFKLIRSKGMGELEKKIITTFSNNGAVAIHQFGSCAKDSDDELSDKDIWITIEDNKLQKVIEDRDKLYSTIGKVVIKFEPPQNTPVGGIYSMVIYETNYGYYHIDYYLVSKSNTKILPESKVIYGDDLLPRGNWFDDQKKLDRSVSSVPVSRIDFLICMSFIGVKYAVRQKRPFFDFLVKEYNTNKFEHYPGLSKIENEYNLKTVKLILDQHYLIANMKQKAAIKKVKQYLSEVESVYYQ